MHAKEAMPPCLSHFYVVCPPQQKLAVLRALVLHELGASAATASGAPPGAGAAAGAATSTVTAGPAAAGERQGGDQSSGHGGGSGGIGDAAAASGTGGGAAAGGSGVGDGAKAVADTRGLVFALPTKPLESIATSLDKALGGRGVTGDWRKQQGQRNSGDGPAPPAPPPLAEFLREELGLNARVRRGLRENENKISLSL